MDQRRIFVFLIALFLVSLALITYSFISIQSQVDKQVQTLRELDQPDPLVEAVGKIWNEYRSIESDARAYILSRDHTFLEKFYNKKDSLSSYTDSLKNTIDRSDATLQYMDSLDVLFDQKALLYDSLLEIQYYTQVRTSLGEMKSQEFLLDDAEFPENKSNVFQRLFNSRFSRKAMQARTDSIIAERNLELQQYRRSQKKIREREEEEIQRLSEIEIALLEKDKKIDRSINDLITAMRDLNEERSALHRSQLLNAGFESIEFLRRVLFYGAFIMLLLVVAISYQVFRSIRFSNALKAERIKAEQLAHAREDFLSAMSHEIRTPLAAITGVTERLEQETQSTSGKKLTALLRSSSEHLLQVVSDVLDNARIERGELVMKSVDFEPFELLHQTAELFVPFCESKGLKLVENISIPPNTLYNGDPVRLRQIIFNLVNNAIKFTHSGTITLNAYCKDESDVSHLHIRIDDTGIGIPENKISGLFDEFSDASTESGKQFSGTGLGLAITYKIIQQLKGDINVSSQVNKGTSFSLQIPYKYVTRPAAVVVEKVVKSPVGNQLMGLQILLCEDDPVLGELMKHELQQSGAGVSLCNNEGSAIDTVARHHPDVMILDIQFGNINGIDLLQKLINIIGKDVPSIAVTANPTLYNGNTGFKEILIKPVESSQLIATVLKYSQSKKAEVRDEQVITTESTYDLTELKKASAGNEEFVKKMINIFMTNSFAGINNMNVYIRNKEWKKVGQVAHKLAPSYEQMGVAALADKLRQVEVLSNEENDTEHITELYSVIQTQSKILFTELKKEINA